MGAYDQAKLEDRMDVLVYTSQPLARDLVLAGPVRLHLSVVTDGRDADYVGKLCVVDGETATNISDRGYRATREIRNGPAGEAITVELDLRSVAALIRAGQRLRLEVTGGSFPMYDINPQSGVPAAHASQRDYVAASHAVLHTAGNPSYLEITVLEDGPVGASRGRGGEQVG
jgi:putative CocE/NonD family hydrolase